MQSINLDIKRVTATQHICCYPGCFSKQIRQVSTETRSKIMMDMRIYLPKGVRACEMHSESNTWAASAEVGVGIYFDYDKRKIEDMIELLCIKPKAQPKVQKSVSETGTVHLESSIAIIRSLKVKNL